MRSAPDRRPGSKFSRPAAPHQAGPPDAAAAAPGLPGTGSQVVYGIHAVTELLNKRREQIHALSMKTLTPAEWASQPATASTHHH